MMISQDTLNRLERSIAELDRQALEEPLPAERQRIELEATAKRRQLHRLRQLRSDGVRFS